MGMSFLLLEDKKSVPDVFSSCSFIPRAQFETSLVMVSCYGYEVDVISSRWSSQFLDENTCFFNFFQQQK